MSCSRYIYSEEYVDFIYDYNYDIQELENKFEPDCVNVLSSRYAQIYKKIDKFNSMPISTYGYNSFVKLYTILNSDINDEIGITKLRRLEGFDYTGRDIIVGFIDTGINYNLDAFRREDGTSKIIGIWDQSYYENQQSSFLNYGRYYDREEINKAILSNNPYELVKETDTIGHGTELAAVVAASFDEENNFEGIAPDVEIAVVKLKEAKNNIKNYYGVSSETVCYGDNDILAGMLFLEEIGRREKKPIIICVGIGSNQGGHEGKSYLSEFIDFLSNSAGVAVVIAGGNEVNEKHHFKGNIELLDRDIDIERIEINVGGEGENTTEGFFLELWIKSPNQISIGIISPTGEIIPMINYNNNNSEEITFLFDRTKVYIDYINNVSNSGNALVFIRFKNPSNGIWNLQLQKKVRVEGRYDAWLPINNLMKKSVRFVASDPDTTLISVANTRYGITVSGYDYKTGGIYVNSSRGLTFDERIKPDIAAPAVNIYTVNSRGNYVEITGTSIAAAIVVGAVAILFEWADYVIIMILRILIVFIKKNNNNILDKRRRVKIANTGSC